MSQSRKHSMLEASLSVTIGYTVAVLAQMFLYPWFGFDVSLADNLILAGFFTIISLIRSYYIRRLFNHWHKTGAL